MASTFSSDLITRAPMSPAIRRQALAQNPFVRAGIVKDSALYDAILAGSGGFEVKLPFFNPLIGSRQIITSGVNLTVNRITAGQDVARIHTDANAWGVHLLARLWSGEDPMAAIASYTGAFWAGEDVKHIISSLKGLFAAPSMGANVHDVSKAVPDKKSVLNAINFIDATTRLGERSQFLTRLICHSLVEAELRKQDQISTIPASDGKSLINVYQGRQLVVCDAVPLEEVEGVITATSYLCGEGAFARGEMDLTGIPVDGGTGSEGIEFQRKSEASETVMYHRRRYILHPVGVRFLSAVVADESPTDEELAMGANWLRVYPANIIPLVSLKHNLSYAEAA